LGWKLPAENYSTLAGLIIHESKTIPDIGQAFSFHGFGFSISRRHKNQITLIKVHPPHTKKTV
jgi:Mg2+/Co2+ transporter CorB